jgi:hypothetical protein
MQQRRVVIANRTNGNAAPVVSAEITFGDDHLDMGRRESDP